MNPGRVLRGAVAVALAGGTFLLTGATVAPSETSPDPTVSATPAPTPTESPLPIPDDPTDPVRAQEYWLDGAGIRDAWYTTRGKGTTIAVIDTGAAKVSALDGAVTGGTDVSGIGSSDGRTPVGTVDSAHGTWVSSIAAARGSADGTGFIGVAPEADILSISVGFGASAAVPFAEQIATAMRWAVDNGADVINLSFTTNTLDWDESWDDAFLYAFEHDVVVVVAAGNRDSGTSVVGAPATIPGVLTVAGVDQTGTASEGASTQGITIGISAPSEGLLGIGVSGDVESWRGTSGAAPIVAGIAALIRSAHPELSAGNVINRITQTAIPAEGVTSVPDKLYGYGLIDAGAAVNADVAEVSTNPADELKEWIRLNRRADTSPAPEPTVTPVAIDPLPPADRPSEASSPLVPSKESLRYGTLPLIALTVPGILIALGVTAAARRIRSARDSREPAP